MISKTKLATVGAAAGLLLASAVPAFAGNHWYGGGQGGNKDNMVINQSNSGFVGNNVSVGANTGANLTGSGWLSGGNNVTTGNATVSGDVSNAINTNYAEVKCDCVKKVDQSNQGFVLNTVKVGSNTGLNATNGGFNVVKSGNAVVSGAVSNVVNANSVVK